VVRVFCKADDSKYTQKRVTIYVKDEGIGFDVEFVERIFQPFQRLHGMGRYEGSGIGLAICRKIVERHAGTITAQSQPGEGATFIITLPAAQS
jgi:signal transduction histidine kinase